MAKKDETKIIKARVLVDHIINGVQCKADDVIDIDTETESNYAGVIDTSPGAVEYAESVKTAKG